jgi:hypothetical protein
MPIISLWTFNCWGTDLLMVTNIAYDCKRQDQAFQSTEELEITNFLTSTIARPSLKEHDAFVVFYIYTYLRISLFLDQL